MHPGTKQDTTPEPSLAEMARNPGGPAPVNMRTFPSGATCSDNTGKPSYLKYISHPVWVRYGQYMLKHEIQADGQRRAPGNWLRGIPPAESLESLMRHVTDVWGHIATLPAPADSTAYEDALCAIIFRAVSMLHEQLVHHDPPGDPTAHHALSWSV